MLKKDLEKKIEGLERLNEQMRLDLSRIGQESQKKLEEANTNAAQQFNMLRLENDKLWYMLRHQAGDQNFIKKSHQISDFTGEPAEIDPFPNNNI